MSELPDYLTALGKLKHADRQHVMQRDDSRIYEIRALKCRIATLESDERRRIAGQILAARYAIADDGSHCVYMTAAKALEIAGKIIRKLEDAK